MKSGKKVVFFTEPNWAFGSIHSSLCKVLYPNVNGEIVDFFQQYSLSTIQEIDSITDLWVTNWPSLLIKEYEISPEKIVFLAHANWDLQTMHNQLPPKILKRLNKCGVISNHLKTSYMQGNWGERGDFPHVARLGIDYDRFANIGREHPVTQLKRIAVMGAYESYNIYGQEIKRGRLVKETIEYINSKYKFGLEFVNFPKAHYLSMPHRYSTLDCVVMASTEEGGGLPMLEAAAAGRLCIGTNVGYFANEKYGVHLTPEYDENEFKTRLEKAILYYIDPFHKFELEQKCREAQRAAMEWDWSRRRNEWLDFLLA